MSDLRQVCLIVPCYNEASRLSVPDFKKYLDLGLRFCFANDGSRDGTLEMLRKEFSSYPNARIFSSEKNVGKAEIIRLAAVDLLSLSDESKGEENIFTKVEWIGFWDGDLATPLEEVSYFLDFQKTFYPQAKAVFGSRILRLGAGIVRSPKRHYLGRIFATLAYLLLRINSYDSQCGAKLFHRDILAKAFSEKFLSRWIFDIEILLRIGESETVEVPVRVWADVPGSKVKISKEALRVLRDLFAIRKKYISG